MVEWEIVKDDEHVGWCWSTNKYADALELARDFQGEDVDVRLVPGKERPERDAEDYILHLRSEYHKQGTPWTLETERYMFYRYTSDCVEF